MAQKETENNADAKFWGDKRRALWYVVVFSGVVNFGNHVTVRTSVRPSTPTCMPMLNVILTLTSSILRHGRSSWTFMDKENDDSL